MPVRNQDHPRTNLLPRLSPKRRQTPHLRRRQTWQPGYLRCLSVQPARQDRKDQDRVTRRSRRRRRRRRLRTQHHLIPPAHAHNLQFPILATEPLPPLHLILRLQPAPPRSHRLDQHGNLRPYLPRRRRSPLRHRSRPRLPSHPLLLPSRRLRRPHRHPRPTLHRSLATQREENRGLLLESIAPTLPRHRIPRSLLASVGLAKDQREGRGPLAGAAGRAREPLERQPCGVQRRGPGGHGEL